MSTHKPESEIQREVQIAISREGVRCFRNNVAEGWIGESHIVKAVSVFVRLNVGDVYIRQARRLHSGLVVGSSDLIGWSCNHNGRFVAVECKSATGRVTDEQRNFIEQVNNAGGIGIIGRSVEQVLEELKRYEK